MSETISSPPSGKLAENPQMKAALVIHQADEIYAFILLQCKSAA